MRRLPADQSLDRLIETTELSAHVIRQLADKLTSFYQALPPLTIKTEDYRSEIERHVRANRAELLHADYGMQTTIVKRVHHAQLRLLKLAPGLLDNRARDGRIIDGHGDLRPEHIYFAPAPTVIDCIEFNKEFRQLDVADELSFLEMELDFLGAHPVGDAIVDAYFRASHDHPPRSLLSFYKCYRACVRAKVHVLRAGQMQRERRTELLEIAEKYLCLAEAYEHELGPPNVIVVRGLMGTGKSTLAAELSDALGIELLQTDTIRKEIFGTSVAPAAYGTRLYDTDKKNVVYREMLDRTADLLTDRLSVVLDGTFLSAELRIKSVLLARQLGAVPLIVNCHCPDEVAEERIAERIRSDDSISEARPELFRRQKQDEEHGPADLPMCDVDTTQSRQSMLDCVLKRIAVEYTFESQ